jgi:exopolyphosphatase
LLLARNIAFDEATGQPLVASTCTLVVEELLHQIQDRGGTPPLPPFDIPPQVSAMLLGTILLDSINLDPRAGKVTDRDRAAVRELLQRTHWDGLGNEAKHALGMSSASPRAEPDCSALFNVLQAAKFDPAFWGSLSVRDVLRLDYKQFSTTTAAEDDDASSSSHHQSETTWGMSTVLLDMDSFFNKPNWEQATGEYMAEHQLAVLVVMLATSSVGGGDDDAAGEGKPAPLERKLVLCDLRNGSVVDDLVEYLVGPQAPLKLQLVEMAEETGVLGREDTSTVHVRAFRQGNAKASRKQVAPILSDYFVARGASS